MNMTREFHAEDLGKAKRFMAQIDWEPFKAFLRENYGIAEEIIVCYKKRHTFSGRMTRRDDKSRR